MIVKPPLEDLERLLSHKTEEIEKYGQILPPDSKLVSYNDMRLFWDCFVFKNMGKFFPKPNRRGLATIVANVEYWGESTGRSLVQWENSRV